MQSFWQQHEFRPFPALYGHHTCDVAIMGAGYTGSWLAYWLKDSGLKVMLVEREVPGYGASGRNGGLLLQGPAQLLAEVTNEIGTDDALRLWRMTRQALDWVRALADQYPLDLHVTGSLYLGASDERILVQESARLAQIAGGRAQLISHHEQPASLRRLELDLGVFFPDDAMIHPLKLIDALLQEASQKDVRVYSHTAVQAADTRDPQGLALIGPGFRIQAQKVLVATNAYIPDWLTLITPHIQPVRGQVIATEPLGPLDYDFPVYADHGFQYCHQRRDGRIVAGGFRNLDLDGEVGTDLVSHPAILERLTQWVTQMVGHPIAISDAWAGIMAMTRDHRPYVGMINDRVGVALGYSGHGSTVTPIAAKLLADQVVDGRPIFPPLSIARLITQKGLPS